MNIIGIDYGKNKIGISRGDTDSKFAEPVEVLRYKKEEKVIESIVNLAKIERVEKLIIGLSEGKMEKYTKEFGRKLAKVIEIPIEYFDETLSTKMAQKLSIEAGMKRKKRKSFEDALSATFMLQNYLERY